MQKRSRAYYRHQRKRIVRKRSEMYLTHWDPEPFEVKLTVCSLLREPGRFAKYNLSCNCMLCKYDKHYSIKTKQDIKSLLSFKEQLEEYEAGE